MNTKDQIAREAVRLIKGRHAFTETETGAMLNIIQAAIDKATDDAYNDGWKSACVTAQPQPRGERSIEEIRLELQDDINAHGAATSEPRRMHEFCAAHNAALKASQEMANSIIRDYDAALKAEREETEAWKQNGINAVAGKERELADERELRKPLVEALSKCQKWFGGTDPNLTLHEVLDSIDAALASANKG